MAVFYLAERYPPRRAMGALTRRSGVIEALNESGEHVVVYELPPTIPAAPALLRFQGTKLSGLVAEVGSGDTVIVEGLAISFAVHRYLVKMRKRGARVVVDVCDSWYALANMHSHTLAQRLARESLIRFAYLRVGRPANVFIYISDNDLKSEWFAPKSRSLVLGNRPLNPSSTVVASSLSWDPGGPILMIGDWSYGVNLKMLSNGLDWIESAVNVKEDLKVRIVGPGLEVPIKASFAEQVGWVDDIREAYEGISAQLVLVENGAGVKTKVLEALSMGIPVITNELGANGIPETDLILRSDRLDPAAVLEKIRTLNVSSIRSKYIESTRNEHQRWLLNFRSIVVNGETFR